MATIEKRTSEEGQVTYRVKVRLKGYPPQTATFQRLTDARKWAQDTESAIREGRHFKTAAAKKHSLAKTIDRYYAEILTHKPNSTANQRHYLKWWRQELGAYALADITPALLIESRSKLLASPNGLGRMIAPSTANRYLAVLGHVFTIAVNQWEWMEINPARKVSKYTEPRGRIRCLSDEEREKLLSACKASESSYLYTIVVLALSTGARKMEILGLKWKDVDLGRKLIVLHQTKNGERRVLPLQGFALSLMENAQESAKMRKPKCDYVFPSEQRCHPIDIRTAWETALRKAKVQDFRFHDLRHSAASYLAMNGASTTEIAAVLGHKSLQMVKRYAHLSEPHTASVVASMNERIFKNG